MSAAGGTAQVANAPAGRGDVATSTSTGNRYAGTVTPGEAPWWLIRLEPRLDERKLAIQRQQDYYDGRHPLQFATKRFREAFGNLFSAFADNWCALVVDVANERLHIEGFRFPQGEGDDGASDTDAWDIWQANNMDLGSKMAHEEALKHGTSYALVAPPPGPGLPPLITVEHPSQAIVERSPENRSIILAGLKKWRDEGDKYWYANVYLPDRVVKFRSQEPARSDSDRITWIDRPDDGGATNPAGLVPLIPIENNPTLLTGGRSDVDPVIDLQNAIDKLVTDMIVASEFGAFRQRYAIGVEFDTDENGNVVNPWKPSADNVWTVGDENATFGEFAESNLQNFVRAIEMLVQHLAAQTRTPPHYLLGLSGAFPSGESLKATETGLVAKCVEKQLGFSDAWEDVVRMAFRMRGDQARAQIMGAETIWRNPESRTEGELVDALLKMKELGVPVEALWERWGASQAEIKRWGAARDRAAMLAAASVFTAPADASGASIGSVPPPASNGAGAT